MTFYLPSYKIGNEEAKLKKGANNGDKRFDFISNTLDFATDLDRRRNSDAMDILDLERLAFNVDVLDLNRYFHKSKELEARLENYDVIWVRGGNTCVLTQAMKLSGFADLDIQLRVAIH